MDIDSQPLVMVWCDACLIVLDLVYPLEKWLLTSPNSHVYTQSHLPNYAIKMLEAKLTSNKTRTHPLQPGQTGHIHTMRTKSLRKHGRLDGVCAKQKVEESVLDPARVLEGVGRARENIVVERGAGRDDFAAGGEGHDDAADDDGLEMRRGWGDVGIMKVPDGRHIGCVYSVLGLGLFWNEGGYLPTLTISLRGYILFEMNLVDNEEKQFCLTSSSLYTLPWLVRRCLGK